MGKKSLTKSTTKKKTQKNVKKKTVDTPATSSGKKQTLRSALPFPLDKQFDSQIPKKPWKPKPDKTFEKNFAAPPFVEGKSKAAKQIRSLLTMTFDLDDAPAKSSKKKEPLQASKKSSPKADAPKQKKPAAETTAKPAKKDEKKAAPAKSKTETPASAKKADEKAPSKPAPAPKKTLPVKELLFMTFDSWQPETLFTPAAPLNNEAYFKAPPAFEGIDKSLILKEFDLTVPDTPKPSVAPEAEKPEPPEPETEGAAPESADAPTSETQEPPASVETSAPVETAKPETATEAPVSVETTASGENGEPPEIKNEEPPEPKPEAPKEATPSVEPAEKPEETPIPPQQGWPGDNAGDNAGDGGDSGNGGGGDGGKPPQPPKKDPMISTGAKILIAAIGVIFLILIASSVANHNRWFIKETREGIELWRGEFSPASKHKVATLKDAPAPEDKKPYYDRKEAMTIAYDHFIGNAREMMEKPDIPVDLQGIRANLEKARTFAITESQKNEVSALLKQVDFTMLIYRADVAAGKQHLEGYERALEYLNQAAAMDMEAPGRRDMLRARIEYVEKRIEALAAEKSDSAKEEKKSEQTEPDPNESDPNESDPDESDAEESDPDEPEKPAEETGGTLQKPENDASSL